jgi:hypothetical protein
VRVPNLDRLDDTRGSTEDRGGDSSADKLEIVDLPNVSDAFSLEPEGRRNAVLAREPEPLAPRLERPERPERPERARPERFERLERFERFERSARSSPLTPIAVGLVALAGVVFITVTLLNTIHGRFASQTEAPLVAQREDRARTSVPTPIPEQLRANAAVPSVDEPPAPPSKAAPAPPSPASASVVAGPAAPVRMPDRQTAQRVEQPRPARSDPPISGVLPALTTAAQPAQRRPESLEAPAAVPAGTTGVRPGESREGPSIAAPSVSTLGTAPAALPPSREPAADTLVATGAARGPVVAAAPEATLKPIPAAAAPAPPAVASAAAAARVDGYRAAVEQVLERYESAFSSLDAQQAKAVWPRVNERNLQRAFDSLEQQEFDLGRCDITVAAPRALALCNGTARYTPRMGDRRMRTESRQWTIRLRQEEQAWTVESVESR